MTENKEVKSIDAVSVADEDLPRSMAACLDNFSRTFEASARRWELVVYPSLLAFIVLAAYGFFLIYTLTSDVTRLAHSMETVVVSMDNVATSMSTVSGNVARISTNLNTMATDMNAGTTTMTRMDDKMGNLNRSVNVMTVPMHQIRSDMSRMNHNMHNVTGPMNMMDGMMPF
ncbi:MAG: hypothetical protein ABFS22_08620 [Pseudomonadota bacterium]